jgi:hypothetical protein
MNITVPGPGACCAAHCAQGAHKGVGRHWPSICHHVTSSATEDDPQPDLDQLVSPPDRTEEAHNCWPQSWLRPGGPGEFLVSHVRRQLFTSATLALEIKLVRWSLHCWAESPPITYVQISCHSKWCLLSCTGMTRSSSMGCSSTWPT